MPANAQDSEQQVRLAASGAAAPPALFRAGDIGVAAEWRDLSYDWTPLLTPLGVSMYEQCRDTYDQQRALYPFLLSPQGPTKQAMQRKLGLRTGYALQGPEHLLATVGLLHVEVDSYGPSADPDRPNRTRVAYYVVGRLDHPTLDWTMLSRILTALAPALGDPAGAQHKKAEAALRALAQAGFFQLCDPDDLFYPLGAWPYLLPTLIEDSRWTALFTHVHGADATAHYREQVRAWVEYAQRLARRLQAENDAIRDQVIAAQRRGGRGGPATPASVAVARDNDVGTSSASRYDQPAGAGVAAAYGVLSPATRGATPAADILSPGTEAASLTPAGSVAILSLASRCPVGVSEAGPATASDAPHQSTAHHTKQGVAALSLAPDQLTQSHCRCQEQETSIHPAAEQGKNETDIPVLAPHLRDAELTSTRYDGTFWCEVNMILYGVAGRYAHSPGEKKAAERRFKQQGFPTGVVLAALRAVMDLPAPQRPQRFGAAISMKLFHACIQQVLALLPSRSLPDQDRHGWPAFLQAYRSIGLLGALRNVSTTDYHVLRGLFQSHPAACWDVLNRVERAATLPNLSPAYLRRAVVNNLQAAAQEALSSSARAACRPVVAAGTSSAVPLAAAAADARHQLLEQAGLSTRLLQPWMTVEYIQAWLDEAAARPNLENVRGWLIWGLSEGCLPHDHPRLPPRPAAMSAGGPRRGRQGGNTTAPSSIAPRMLPSDQPRSWPAVMDGEQPADETCSVGDHDLHQLWSTALSALAQQLPSSEFEVWLRPSRLLEVAGHQAVIGVPHIFAREKVTTLYIDIIEKQLQQLLGLPVTVLVEID